MSREQNIQWFYIDNQQKQQGPLTTEQIKQYFQIGTLNQDTFLWHSALPQWTPLRQLVHDLDLMSTAPPMSAPYSPPHKKGLSGCAIFAIVGAILLLVIPVIIAILAAIGLPLYQDNIAKAQANAALAEITPGKTHFEVAIIDDERNYLNNSDIGLPDSSSHCSEIIVNLETRVIACLIKGPAVIDEKTILWRYDDTAGNWSCETNLDEKYRPRQCY